MTWNVEDILDSIKAARVPPESKPVTGIDAASLERLNAIFGRALPIAYVEFLGICNGSFAGPGGLFGFGAHPEHLDIVHYWETFPQWRTRGWIPVASDGCGNYYLLVANGELGAGNPIVFVEGMSSFDIPAFVVASNLWTFLWFYLESDRGETRWPFVADFVLAADPKLLLVQNIALPWNCSP